jgi:hypothetical protein
MFGRVLPRLDIKAEMKHIATNHFIVAAFDA